MRRSDPPLKKFPNPNPSGKYSRFTAKKAVSEPNAAISVVAKVVPAINRLNETKLPITDKNVTNIRRINRAGLLVAPLLSAGNQVRKRAIGPLNNEIARIIATRITSDSMAKD